MQVVYSECTASGVYNVMKCVHNDVTSVGKKRPDWEDVKPRLELECLHNRRLSTPRPPLGLTIEGWDCLLSLTPGLKVNSQLVVSIWLVAINIQLDSVLQMGVYKQNFLHSIFLPSDLPLQYGHTDIMETIWCTPQLQMASIHIWYKSYNLQLNAYFLFTSPNVR